MTWNEIAHASLDAILAWANDQPWCRAMAACQQDAEWHSEGDVWTHTQMVCAQLPQLDDWPTLSSHERTLLIFTALFHDAGKPLTSQADPTTGRIQSPKHAIKGEHLARSVLRDVGCDLTTREEIARLIRFHGRPAFLLEKSDPNHEVVSLSWWLSNRLLYLFALADTRGRQTADMGRPEENMHFWKLVACENRCFDRPYPFANDHARFLFYRQREPDLHFVPYEDYRCTVTVMSGLPGSGKDTWLATNRPGLPVVSLDDLR
ncbi:MAG: HD domain-containing protein, partial [Pirellulales bacterium]